MDIGLTYRKAGGDRRSRSFLNKAPKNFWTWRTPYLVAWVLTHVFAAVGTELRNMTGFADKTGNVTVQLR
jgi:hypothetical protein